MAGRYLYTGEVRDGAAQAFFEGDFRLPAHECLGLLVGERRAVDVALARGLMRGMELPAHGLAEDRDEVVEARLRLRAEVVGRVDMLRRQRVDDAARDIPRVDEVARLSAIAEDRQPLAARDALRKDADDAALPLVALPLAVDISKAQHDVVEAVELLVERQIMLHRDLRQAVERQRRQRQILRDRQHILRHIAIRRRRRRKDHALHAARARRLEHIDRAEHILTRIEMRVADRRIDHRLASQMHDRIEMPRRDARPRLRCPVIELPEREPLRRQMLPHPRRQIVQHRDPMPERQQQTNQVRPNESRTTSDQDLHPKLPIPRRKNPAKRRLKY